MPALSSNIASKNPQASANGLLSIDCEVNAKGVALTNYPKTYNNENKAYEIGFGGAQRDPEAYKTENKA